MCRRILSATFAIVLMAVAGPAYAVVCVVGPAGDLPPQCHDGGGYLSPNDVHMILDGLPPGAEIHLGAEHGRFFDITRGPDGALGENETFKSVLTLHITTHGPLPPYDAFKTMQTQDQTNVGPDLDPDPDVRSHVTQFLGLAGEINVSHGDPDFDLLRVRAGSTFSLPSPGHTTLTRLGNGNWAVDSFFDITYKIDFIGKAGGPFSGMSGSTTGTIRMAAGESVPEPATICLLGLAAIGAAGLTGRRRRAA